MLPAPSSCRAVIALALGLLSAGGRLSAADLTGRLELLEAGAPAADVKSAIVYYEPEARTAPAAPRAVEIDTRQKRFLPRVTVVPVGSTVRFPNRDLIVHNVFSISPRNHFDLGRYGEGEGRSTRFEAPGLVRVYCNVHHSMVAYVLVLATPFVTSPDADGVFTLAGVPAGRGRITVWHERAGAWSQAVEIPAMPLVARLSVTQSGVPRHLDKHGKPYPFEEPDREYR